MKNKCKQLKKIKEISREKRRRFISPHICGNPVGFSFSPPFRPILSAAVSSIKQNQPEMSCKLFTFDGIVFFFFIPNFSF